MKSICSIVSGGPYSNLDGIEKSNFIIACDKGYEHLKANNLEPDLLIGDLDSCEEIIPKTVKKIILPKEKDDTDTMAAIKYAIFHEFEEIKLYCSLGGRFDHTIANIQSCIFGIKKIKNIKIYDRYNEIYFVRNSKINISKKVGYSLSIFSITDTCKNVSIKNAKYNLNNATLKNSVPIGVSNYWLGDPEISVGSGILMIILSKLEKNETLQSIRKCKK